MMDPYTFMAMNTAFTENPELVAQMFGGMGIPPQPLAGIMPSATVPGTSIQGGLPAPSMTPFLPGGGPGMGMPEEPPAGAPNSRLAAMSGLKGMPQPGAGSDRPITSGGVSGAQQAPVAKMGAGQQSAVSQALLNLLMPTNRPNPLVMPTLGQLISGGR